MERDPYLDSPEFLEQKCFTERILRRVFCEEEPYEHPLDPPLRPVTDWPRGSEGEDLPPEAA